MSVIQMLTRVDPQVILYLPEDPQRFQARISNLAAHFLSVALENTQRLGGDSPLSSMGRILSAIAATEIRLKDDFVKRGTPYLSASLNLGWQGEFNLEIAFQAGFPVPSHSSIAIQ
jgi:hypothetical protein